MAISPSQAGSDLTLSLSVVPLVTGGGGAGQEISLSWTRQAPTEEALPEDTPQLQPGGQHGEGGVPPVLWVSLLKAGGDRGDTNAAAAAAAAAAADAGFINGWATTTHEYGGAEWPKSGAGDTRPPS